MSAPPDRHDVPVDTAQQSAKGHIHNIGYRSYTGERLGRAYATRSLFLQSLRGAYGLGRSGKSKVLPMLMLGVICIPAAIIVAVTIVTSRDELPIEYTRYTINVQAIITIFLAAQAPQAVSRDLRFATMPLYFSRPIERVDYVVAKFAAMTGAMFILTGIPQLILYVGALLAKLPFGHETAGVSKGLLAAFVLSVLYAGLALVIAALTPRRGFGVAAIIAAFIISYAAVSAVQGVADPDSGSDLAAWAGLFSPATLIDGLQSWVLGAIPAMTGNAPPNAGMGMLYLLVLLGGIACSFGLLMRRYRRVGLS